MVCLVPDMANSTATQVRDTEHGWTFPAGLILFLAAYICLAVFVFYPRISAPPCEMRFRLELSFVLPAALGGLLIPLMFNLHAAIKLAISLCAAAVSGLVAWWAVASVFPSFC